MDFKWHIETAWKQTVSNIVPLVLMTLVMTLVSGLTFGLMGPVTMAGYIQSILFMLREGREPKIQDIFSQMNLFFPLLGFGVLAFIAILIGFLILFLPGFLIVLTITFCCLYMLPLMTDKGLAVTDAIKESYRMAVTGQILDHVVVVVLYMGIIAIGGSVFIGFLFTCPLATVFLASVYNEKTGAVPEVRP
jgi:membrane-anchored glycerophosphoryl diester phosphodiesterase (GDPDase)